MILIQQNPNLQSKKNQTSAIAESTWGWVALIAKSVYVQVLCAFDVKFVFSWVNAGFVQMWKSQIDFMFPAGSANLHHLLWERSHISHPMVSQWFSGCFPIGGGGMGRPGVCPQCGCPGNFCWPRATDSRWLCRRHGDRPGVDAYRVHGQM